MTQNRVDPALRFERPTWRQWLWILPIGLAYLVNLDALPVTGSETRWVTIAEGMRSTGDLLNPEIHGEFYGDKPLLSYWLIWAASLGAGGVDEGVARIPSAIAGLLVVGLTLWLAARVIGRRACGVAAVLTGTAYYAVLWSRTASADMLNLAFTVAGVMVYVEWIRGSRPWTIVVFCLLLALGGQAKGLPAIVVPVAIVGAEILLSRRRRILRQVPWVVVGVLGAAALYLVPFYLSYLQRGDWQLLYLVYRENLVRAVDAFDHTGPVYLYLVILPVMCFPWSVWLPGALGWSWRERRENPGLRFVLLGFVVTFLLFTASESRRSYYLLPILPYSALLVAGFIDAVLSREVTGETAGTVWRALFVWPLLVLGVLLTVVCALALAGGVLPGDLGRSLRMLPWLGVLGLVFLPLVVGFWISIRGGRLRLALRIATLGMVALALYSSFGFEPTLATGHLERPFANEVKSRFPGRELIYFDRVSDRMTYYLGPRKKVWGLENLHRALSRASPGTLVVIPGNRKRSADELLAEIEATGLFRCTVLHKAVRPGIPPILDPVTVFMLLDLRPR